eukprot:scaffold64785_cov50-Phaeocystis_antarctica.AAC.2
MAPPKRAAPPESASAPSAKRTFRSPYHEFCQDQRPHLPLGMAGRDREKLLALFPAPCHAPGQRWKALPEAEKARYKAGLTKLLDCGQGGVRAWAPTSASCLPPAPTTAVVPG